MNSRIHPFVPFLVIAAGLLFEVLVWFVWYPLVGYSDVTRRIAQLAFAALGLVLLFGLRLHSHRIGLGKVDLLWAVLGIAVAYSLLLAVLLIVTALGAEVRVFRQSYPPVAVLDNWLLTGLGEELFFAGVLFNVLRAAMGRRAPRWAVLFTAASFAMWHLPGYLAIA